MLRFHVEGMTCGGCSSAVEAALENAGFTAVVDLQMNTATVDGDPDPKAVIQAIEDAGFDARLSDDG